jgi:hypothetical protein
MHPFYARFCQASLIRQLDSFCTVESELFLYSDTPLVDRKRLLMQVRVCVRVNVSACLLLYV